MSFRLKTILGVALIEALLLVFMIYSSLNFLTDSNEKAFSSQTRTTAMLFAAAAKDATISTDLASLESLVNELMRYDGIAYVSVRSPDGTVLAERWADTLDNGSSRIRSLDGSLDEVNDGVFDMRVGIDEGGERFGFVNLGFFSNHIDKLVSEAQSTLIGIGAAEMVLVALFSFLLGTWLTRNLSDLKIAAERLTRGEYGYQVPIQGDNEVSATAIAFNQMSAEILRSKDQLLEAKRVAERSNESKTEFLMNMTHELRSPLQGIIGFADLGGRRVQKLTPDKVKTYFGTISDSGNTLLTLVNNLLDLSKCEAGHMELTYGTCTMENVVEKVVTGSAMLIKEKSIDLNIHGANAATLSCDSEKIEQVVRNLISNAVKFTEPGGQINVSMAVEGTTIVTQVQDSGIGIPDDELDWVFERFVQSTTTKTKAGGTGLGLAIARAIAVAHGGALEASNNPGKGATFTLTLPLERAQSVTGDDTAQSMMREEGGLSAVEPVASAAAISVPDHGALHAVLKTA